MSRWALALLAIAVLISFGQWASMYAAEQMDAHVLPAHARRRVLWMHGHTRYVYLACLLAAIVATTAAFT